ncbi:MAG: N-6 DNA methylase, partial [Desulfobacterales bacterium]|nr:N-6 DNA methylase [Desulfobacterales bacterium]
LEKFACPALSFRPGPGGNAHMVGAAGQFLIKKFAEGSGKKAGEFYTPPEVADLMAELMAPRRGDEICDPACGAGSFLLACGRKIRERYNGSRNYTLYGQEAVDSIWAMAKMNLFLNGEDNHRLEWGDVIRDPKLIDEDGGLKRFDVVAAHPPSGMRKWGVENAETDSFGRFRLGVPPKSKADYAFILHMIETLEPDRGRMAFASPNGVLYRGEEEGVIRKKLIEENLLDAVIGLPEKLLYGTDIL